MELAVEGLADGFGVCDASGDVEESEEPSEGGIADDLGVPGDEACGTSELAPSEGKAEIGVGWGSPRLFVFGGAVLGVDSMGETSTEVEDASLRLVC